IAYAGRLDDPAQEMGVGLDGAREIAPGECVPSDVAHAGLDLPLVARGHRAAGRGEKVVVLGELPVTPLRFGVVDHGPRDRRLEIVDDEAVRDAAEPFEGVDVAADPCLDALVEDDLSVLVAAEGERHDEDPSLPELLQDGIKLAADVAEVDLRLLS